MRTLHENLNILKQRLDETRITENKKDLAELWTKYHIYAREIEQQIEDYTTVIATRARLSTKPPPIQLDQREINSIKSHDQRGAHSIRLPTRQYLAAFHATA